MATLFLFHGTASASSDTACTTVDRYVSFCLNVPTGAVRRETSIPLVALPSQRADVRVEVTVPGSDAAGVAADVDGAVVRVETLFGRTFSARPRVLLFGTKTSFATGAAELFGYSADTAKHVASTYGGIFDRTTATIAINWSAIGRARASAAIAHELTHLMIHEIARGNDVPVWFDEGVATLVQGDLPAITTPDVSLRDLTTLAGFHRTYAEVGDLAYQLSEAAVRDIEARAGWDGVIEILSAVGDGRMFDDVYAAVTDSSLRSLDSSLRAVGIAVSPVDATGNVVWMIAGMPNAEIHVSIAGGRDYRVTFTVTADARGMYRGSFGSTAAPGSYTVSAAGAAATFSTVR